MKIKVLIQDALTKEIIRKNEVKTPEYTMEQMEEFHNQFKRKYPNAHINFVWRPKNATMDSFICGMPLNMQIDEIKLEKGLITEEEYESKWFQLA